MVSRATWKGQLQLSLVSFPVRLYNAVRSTSRVTLNQLHKGCHRRLKQQMKCPAHGDVERADIARGYEYEKSKFVVIDETDLQRIRLETTKTIQLVQFIGADELDPIFLDAPYYVAPDGRGAEEVCRVLREAMRESNRVGIGRVVLSSREHSVALQVQEPGLLLTTLRYAHEVRSAAPFFEDLRSGEVEEAPLRLAQQLIEQHTRPFDPTQFTDRYQDSLLEVVTAKIAGSEPIRVQEEEVGRVINLMEALEQSLSGAEKKKRPRARTVKRAAARKPAKRA